MGSQRGSAALLGLIMMMLLGSMGATLLLLSKTDLQIAINYRDGMAAQYLAEAGIQYAASKLKNDQNFVSQTETGKSVMISEPLGLVPTVGTYTVQTELDPATTNNKIRLITATGVVNQARRQVIAHITLPQQLGETTPLLINWNY